MKKTNNKTVGLQLFLAAGFAMILLFQNCSQVEFSPAEKTGSSVQPNNEGTLSDPTVTTNNNEDTSSPLPNNPSNPNMPQPPVVPNTPNVPVVPKVTASLKTGSEYVCSPFGNITVPSSRSGLRAELRYVDPDAGVQLSTQQKNGYGARTYFDDSRDHIFKKAQETVYLGDVNTPTRNFSSGFTPGNGMGLKNSKGELLVEWFALRMETVFKLTANDPEGYYEFATISDDGSIVQIQVNGQWVDLVGNDGAHPTRMDCASTKVLLKRDTHLPMRIYYNQGPRYGIANVLMWNYRGPAGTTASNLPSDSTINKYCFDENLPERTQAERDLKYKYDSETKYWDRNNNSRISDWGLDLLNNLKWRIPVGENFQLPDEEVNPCAYSNYDVVKSISVLSADENKVSLLLSLKEEAATGSIRAIGNAADGSKDVISSQTVTKGTDILIDLKTSDLKAAAAAYPKVTVECLLNLPGKNLSVRKEWVIEIK